MILIHPATLGTIVWAVLTVALILLAGRGTSAVWDISTGLVKGVRSWSRRGDGAPEAAVSPRAVELPPLGHVIQAGAAARSRESDAEVEDLPSRAIR